MRDLKTLLGRNPAGDGAEAVARPERCLSCDASLEGSRSYERFRVCHSCGFHFHLTARERITTLLDAQSFHEDDRGVTSIDPISFPGRQSYRSRVIQAQRRTGLTESALTGTGRILGREVVIAVLDFSFLGGSIGVASGERLARSFERATARRIPVVTVCSTSGTRMQEGLLALMQAPRVVAAAARHGREGLPHIAVLTDPTTGSAYAGFVSLADVIIAEPNALAGYAAMRVLQEQDKEIDLPPGTHTSESHLRHGLVDAIVQRAQLRDTLAHLLDLVMNDYQMQAPRRLGSEPSAHSAHGAWQQVQISRHESRPTATDYIGRMTGSFVEIRGDRHGEDDRGLVAGFASIGGESVVIVGQNRPHGVTLASPWLGASAFRKAERAMKLAGKFRLPLVTLIDTAGADPSHQSEEAGLGRALASCMATMLDLPVPTIAVIIGEANSEGAAAMAVADRVLMLDNAVYEVIRPEDAASILSQETGETAERLRITSHDCLKMGIVDVTVSEPGDGAHTDHDEAALLLRRSVLRELARMQGVKPKKLLERRYHRYREMGSTHSWLRGSLERRVAHLSDRLAGMVSRLRGRGSNVRRRVDGGDYPDIPV